MVAEFLVLMYRNLNNLYTRSNAPPLKKIEALGGIKLLLGGSASMAAVDDLRQATGRDLHLMVGQKHNAIVGGDMVERICRAQINFGIKKL
ncbi:hypothetical protein RYA99_21380 [Pseudomonas syringae pv. actinidifoliorum]|nr:hypothetical protein [Pseudomonas syringae pv. actinidifoliorum]MDU8521647.1 hypothetical protein [Pseudomonas syringae pv. actinidifoliorum]MDU8528732.1 hypothetical protein [Pseudomonas syringae pv. actinidifoliorum]